MNSTVHALDFSLGRLGINKISVISVQSLLIAALSQVNICHVTNSFQNLEWFNKLNHEEQSVIYRN